MSCAEPELAEEKLPVVAAIEAVDAWGGPFAARVARALTAIRAEYSDRLAAIESRHRKAPEPSGEELGLVAYGAFWRHPPAFADEPWRGASAVVRACWSAAALAVVIAAIDAELAKLSAAGPAASAPIIPGWVSPDGIPRRSFIDRSTPAESAIRAAMQAVEAAGADVRLTHAVILLDEAREHVADFVDGVPCREPKPPPVDREAVRELVEAEGRVFEWTIGNAADEDARAEILDNIAPVGSRCRAVVTVLSLPKTGIGGA